MFRCFTCGERVPLDEDQSSSRCSRCREPIYEDPRESRSLPASPKTSRCSSHEQNAAIGTCQRCGNFMCPTCRTPWRGQVVCLGCVTRALESREAVPAEGRAHFRQAILSLVLGGLAWLIGLASLVMMMAGMADGPNIVLLILGFLGLLAAPFPALLGIGQGAAAIRARGDHMILATLGLFLSGLHTGVFLGFLTFALWQNQ